MQTSADIPLLATLAEIAWLSVWPKSAPFPSLQNFFLGVIEMYESILSTSGRSSKCSMTA